MSPNYPPIVFFDLEGTLLRKCYRLDQGQVAPSAWAVLAESLGPSCLAEELETQQRWSRGEYPGYVEWMRDTIRIHRKYGLTRHVFEQIMNSVDFMPGAEEVFAELRANGVITAVISGGFKALGDRVQRRFLVDHAICACEYFFGIDGFIEHFNLLPSDEKGKIQFMRLIADEHGFDPVECAFVGDGMNDVHLAKAVGFSIAFNAQAKLQEACTTSIVQNEGNEDLREVIQRLAGRHAFQVRGYSGG